MTTPGEAKIGSTRAIKSMSLLEYTPSGTSRLICFGVLAVVVGWLFRSFLLPRVVNSLVFPTFGLHLQTPDPRWYHLKGEWDGAKLYRFGPKRSVNSKSLLFLHGNFARVQDYHQDLVEWERRGYQTYALEYSGYSPYSTHAATAGLLVQNVKEAVVRIASENLEIYGLSIGGGLLAASLHELRPVPTAITFDSSFAKLGTVVNRFVRSHLYLDLPYYEWLVSTPMALNETYARNYKGAVTIVHAHYDTVVAVENAHALSAAFFGNERLRLRLVSSHGHGSVLGLHGD
jgi:hypothetical protein